MARRRRGTASISSSCARARTLRWVSVPPTTELLQSLFRVVVILMKTTFGKVGRLQTTPCLLNVITYNQLNWDSWRSKVESLKEPDDRFSENEGRLRHEDLEADYQTNREVTEYQTLSLSRKMSNFEIVSEENKKLLGELEEIKMRRRNLGLLVRQHHQEQQTLQQMVGFKFSREDLRWVYRAKSITSSSDDLIRVRSALYGLVNWIFH